MWPFSSSSSSSQSSDPPAAPPSACPVDDATREKWLRENGRTGGGGGGAAGGPSSQSSGSGSSSSSKLSSDRVISSIPRWLASASESSPPASSSSGSKDAATPPASCPSHLSKPGASSSSSSSDANPPPPPPAQSNWVYPSPSQFHAALVRKGRASSAEAASMDIVVPIHNAVNERCWEEILAWERDAAGGEAGAARGSSWQMCGGPKLVSFQGRPKDVTWKAWGRGLLGYEPPFDRHDWIVDRCGHRTRYIIDFYAGRGGAPGGNPFAPAQPGEASSSGQGGGPLSFYLDVRPAPDTVEGLMMRARRAVGLGKGPEAATATAASKPAGS